VKYVRLLLEEMSGPMPKSTIHEDNTGAIFMVKNSQIGERTKHIDTRHHYVKEQVEDGMLEVVYINTADNPADVMTKNVKEVIHKKLALQIFEGLLHPESNKEDVNKTAEVSTDLDIGSALYAHARAHERRNEQARGRTPPERAVERASEWESWRTRGCVRGTTMSMGGVPSEKWVRAATYTQAVQGQPAQDMVASTIGHTHATLKTMSGDVPSERAAPDGYLTWPQKGKLVKRDSTTPSSTGVPRGTWRAETDGRTTGRNPGVWTRPRVMYKPGTKEGSQENTVGSDRTVQRQTIEQPNPLSKYANVSGLTQASPLGTNQSGWNLVEGTKNKKRQQALENRGNG
jgi:hypothetical protein